MTYTNYDEVKAILDAQWNAAIIAEPDYKDGTLSMETYHSRIYIKFDMAVAPPATTGAGSKDKITTEWQMRLIAENKVNVDKYLDEVRRIINGYDLTNGFWHVDSWKLAKTGKIFYYECECSETLWDFA